jgi:hypothetical protein
MPNITIAGHQFEVPEGVLAKYDNFMHPDAPDGLRHTVRQIITENLRNNFAKKVKDKANGGKLAPDAHAALQTEFNTYADKYEMGVRSAGSAVRVVRDPLEKEMQALAKTAIQKAYFAKHGEKVGKEQLAAAVENLLSAKHDEYEKKARAILKQRESVGTEDLAAAGL